MWIVYRIEQKLTDVSDSIICPIFDSLKTVYTNLQMYKNCVKNYKCTLANDVPITGMEIEH